MKLEDAILNALVEKVSNAVFKGIQEGFSGLSGVSTGVFLRFGREKTHSLVGYVIPAQNEKIVINLPGPGRVVGGNIVLSNTDRHLHDVKIRAIVDNIETVNDDIESLKAFGITEEDLSPVYVVKYYEDLTTAGSWVSEVSAHFVYTIGLSETYYEDGYKIYLYNPSDQDIRVNVHLRYYYWGG